MLTRIVQIPLAFFLTCHAVSISGLAYPSATCNLADASFKSHQIDSEQSKLIDEAEKNKYLVRRIEFVGNANTRHHILARRVLFTEGDVFTRKLLERSLSNLSKLKIIKPVRLQDVEVYLDREEKLIDLNILIREKRRS